MSAVLISSVILAGVLAQAEEAMAPRPDPLAADAGRGSAVVRVVTSPPGLAVSVDGKLVGLSPREEVLSAGVHTVTAERGGEVLSETFSVSVGERRTVTLALKPPPKRSVPVVGAVTFGAGAVVLATGLLLQLPARDAAREVSLLFERGGGWDAAAQRLEDAGLRAQNWSYALSVVGSALLASGLAAAVLELATTKPPPVVLVPTAQGAAFAWSGTW